MAVAQQKCCVFIDNSNLFIEGKKFYARNIKLRASVAEDSRFRIEIGRLVEALRQGRKIIFAKLYGSKPPPNDSLWEEIRNREILVETLQRSSTNYEKEVDTSLTADVTEQSCEFRHQEPTGSVTFIIIGGDRDYRPASKMVLKHKWKLEIVAWESCLANEVKSFVRDNKDKDASLTLLDNLAADYPHIYFLADKWKEKKRIPPERTIAFEYKISVKDKEAKQLNYEVTDLIKLPCRYMHRPEKDPNIVLIIVIIEQEKGGYDTCTLCEEIKAKFSDKCERIIHFATFIQVPGWENDDLFDYVNIYVSEENKNESEHIQTHEATGGARIEGGGTEGGADEPEDAWTLVVRAKQHKSKQKSSEQCKHGLDCRYGLKCHKAHTETEKQHFKNHPMMFRFPYKTQLCTFAGKKTCEHQQNPKQCCFAHNLAEARCYNCHPGGLEGDHWMDQCPNKRS